MIRRFEISINNHEIKLTTDQSKFQSFDSLIMAMLVYYKRNDPQRMRHLLKTINTQHEEENRLQNIKKTALRRIQDERDAYITAQDDKIKDIDRLIATQSESIKDGKYDKRLAKKVLLQDEMTTKLKAFDKESKEIKRYYNNLMKSAYESDNKRMMTV